MAQSNNPMTLVDWLDDICVRFIVNLPREELESVQRIMFQIEEGHWYYEDFIRPLDPTLPSINLKQFCSLIFHHCPLLAGFSHYHAVAYAEFSAYKTRVPVRGAIMLNQDMTKAVLVKGWKKGAKWSFPRGKINKDESDFDCAVREVYEETGYDLRAAGIATDEASSHHLEVTLREQQMRLYVFRGVPMETHFEPLTRKEISKIEWYIISDLPGGKSKKHIGPDDALRHNQFYMVTPFIGELKNWIKQQRKKEKLLAGFIPSDTARVDDSGVGTDMEAMAPEVAQNDAAEARHFNSLLSRLNKATFAPQLSSSHDDGSSQTEELALQLKRLLSVGGATETSKPASQPNTILPSSNPAQGMSLLSLLQPSAHPQTPFHQITVSPEQARTPHHNHPGPPQFHQAGPPPTYGFPQGGSFPGPQQTHQSGYNMSAPNHATYPPPTNNWYQHGPLPDANPSFTAQSAFSNTPHMPLGTPADRSAQENSSHPATNAPSIITPQPNLNAHSLNLLNAFKGQQAPGNSTGVSLPMSQTSAFAGQQHQPHTAHHNFPPSIYSPQNISQMPPQSSGSGPTNAKSMQTNTLLSLFQGAGIPKLESVVGSADRPAELAPPVAELSAGSPRNTAFKESRAPAKQLPNIDSTVPAHRNQLTSATVSGPLNAPIFESITRNTPPVELGTAPEPTITPVPVHSVSPGMPLEAPRAMHHPSILDRQTTPANMSLLNQLKAGQPSLPSTFDKRGTLPTDQKTALMSLFGKQTIQAVKAASSQQPQYHNMSGVPLNQQRIPSQNSPVSPLPARVVPMKATSQYTSQPNNPTRKTSRVSSIADETTAGLVKSPITPVEQQNFLLQYLQDVVTNEGRG